MKIDKVVLTKDEAAWFSRNVLKSKMILEAASKKDPNILERVTYKTLAQLEENAKEIASTLEQLADEPYEIEVYPTRKQRVVLSDMLKNTMKLINTVIIPEYEKRSLIDREKYKSYLDEAKTKVEMLKAFRKKL